ncbi:Gfo/Idh/MocA family protein [Flagellimonas nanhaiensis]|uniref:Gfo/Idh/MocA family oxidoreductase n=1 Tax=Flagellimonas nanhaiensis TaxID=2292706 RepID=A0A371JP58_9FLAO|nr:Gfo/Idh/MocA family oxidoreductase [Allomuricauda nanhaiensis]RDY59298.1 gfo/Idh/MocA family oxidoreductase [Allomuricauda nanhaiensis]
MKRREFIVKGGIATTAIACNPIVSFANKSNAGDMINLGIIGTGDRGTGLMPAINQIKGLRTVGCCDVIPFRLEEGKQMAGGNVTTYSDYRKLLDNKDIDAVLVTTPFSTHSQIAIDALDAGKHVFCEKTMAKGYDGISQMVSKVSQTDAIFQVGHQFHSSRLYQHIVGLIKQGKIGKITAFEFQWNRNGNWRRPVPDPKWEKAINWRMYREFSGGLLAELCSHQLDFANWVLEDVPESVVGVGGIDYWKDGRETFDNIHLIYSYPNGVKAKFTCLTSNAMGDYQVKILGDKGSIVMGQLKAWFYPEKGFEKEFGNVDGVSGATVNWNDNKGIPINIEHEEPSKQALMDFRDGILNNEQPLSGIKSGADTSVCVQMGLDAMYQGKMIKRKDGLTIH